MKTNEELLNGIDISSKLKKQLERELNKIDNRTRPEKPSFTTVIKERKDDLKVDFFISLFILFVGHKPIMNKTILGFVFIIGACIPPVVELISAYRFRLYEYNNWDNSKLQAKQSVIAEFQRKDILAKDPNYRENTSKTEQPTPVTNIVINANNSDGKVHCPYCNSSDVKKISTLNRAISIGIIGLASGKIGRQWHCNGCGSNF